MLTTLNAMLRDSAAWQPRSAWANNTVAHSSELSWLRFICGQSAHSSELSWLRFICGQSADR